MVKSAFRAIGSSGRNQWGNLVQIDRKPELEGLTGVRTFKNMLYDPTAMLMYQALALPLRTVTWDVIPGGVTAGDQQAAALAWDALKNVSGGWLALLSNVGSMFWAGWAYLEMVLQRRADGYVGFEEIALRPQETLSQWRYAHHGAIVGMEQSQASGGIELVPLKRSLLFRTTAEADNPEGWSIFKAAHRTWQYKRKLEQVEGIGLQRRWAGFPVLNMPVDATTRAAEGENSDEAKAEALIQSIYEDKQMGAYLPGGWGLNFGGPSGNTDPTMGDTIMRKDMEMARSILAQFLLLGLRSVGTQALAGSLGQTFALAVDAHLNSVADEFNRYAFPYLFKYNKFPGMTALPALVHASAQSLDLGAVGAFIDSLTRAGVSVVDRPTVNFLRGLIPGMPAVTEQESGGEVAAPGAAERREIEAASLWTGERFAVGDGLNLAQLEALVAANKKAQTAVVEALANDVGAELADLGPDATAAEARNIIDDLVLAALLLFRERSVLDITAAFWLGYGEPAGGGEVLPALQREIGVADSWSGYGADGRLVRINPAGKPTLFGDIAGELEGQIAAILLLLKQGRGEEVFGLVQDATRAATRGGTRPALHAGNVYHAGWQGAVEREKYADNPVRWRLDPQAKHCITCLRFNGTYSNLSALLSLTGGILPGYGTECDGGCRCTLEALRGGVWLPL